MVSGSPITPDVTGEEHFSVIYEIQESPHEPGVIWVGANDGPIHLTRDGGRAWHEVTPDDLGPYGRVQTIEVSPHDPAKAYAAILRYQLGDFAPYAYRTEDYGESWTRISTGTNGIPADHPVRVVREDPDRVGLLYAGTEFGIFVSFDDGGVWQPFQLNFPVTPVTDIKIVQQDLVLSTMGRGFWILDDLTPLHGLSEAVASAEAHLYEVRNPYRLRGSRRSRTPTPSEPEYPAIGANIDYYLAHAPAGPLRLDILGADGHVIRAFTSEAPVERPALPEPPGPDGWELEGAATPPLPAAPGMHRFVWDLRYPGPWHEDPERTGTNGPMVRPGTYRARLTSGSWSETRSFEARMDPRVSAEGITPVDVTTQVELALQVRDALSAARLAAARLALARQEYSEDGGGSAQRVLTALDEIKAQLVTAPIRYSRPMIIDQLVYLYDNLNRADQRPGRDATDRYAELNGMLQDHIGNLEQVLRTQTR